MGKAALKPDHKLHIYKHILANIHELITLAYDSYFSSIGLLPRYVDAVAEDASNIGSRLSVDPTHNK